MANRNSSGVERRRVRLDGNRPRTRSIPAVRLAMRSTPCPVHGSLCSKATRNNWRRSDGSSKGCSESCAWCKTSSWSAVMSASPAALISTVKSNTSCVAAAPIVCSVC